MKTHKLISTALLLALGVLLPRIFHSVRLGRAFLPMHLPALLAGLLLGPGSGLIVGVLTPLLSTLFTGSPPPAIAVPMLVELGAYGLAGGLLYQKRRLNVYLSLVLAIVCGRLVYGLFGATLLPLLGFDPIPVFYLFTAGLLEAIPGLVLQLVVIPLIVKLVERSPAFKKEESA
ncbi:MAG: ECF transporter S component [Firmicutes bacterium]|nr:ECF transporter S component [Bacillota bacterium]